MKQKLLTIIVPSYNMEAYLRKNCDSLLIGGEEQEWLDVILVNDGSIDQTSAIAHEYATRFPTVFRVIDKANGHYGSCVNAGLAVAKGVYTKVLDADDYVDTEAFRVYVKTLAEEDAIGSIDFVISDWTKVDSDGKRFDLVHYPFAEGKITVFDIGSTWFDLHAIAYRTKLLHDMNYRQTEGCLYTDAEWFNHPLAFVEHVLYIPQCVTCYLLGREGQSMEEETVVRNIGVAIQMVLNNMKAYQRVAEEIPLERRLLQRERVFWRIVTVYEWCLLGVNGKIPEYDLEVFDNQVRQFDMDLYESVGKRSIKYKILGIRIKFYYIRAWRKQQTRKTLSFWLYDKFSSSVKKCI